MDVVDGCQGVALKLLLFLVTFACCYAVARVFWPVSWALLYSYYDYLFVFRLLSCRLVLFFSFYLGGCQAIAIRLLWFLPVM